MYAYAIGAISQAGDLDWFRVPAQAGDLLWVLADTLFQSSPGQTQDSVVGLYDSGGVLLEEDDNDGTAVQPGSFGPTYVQGKASTIAGYPIAVSGEYFLRVRARSPADTMSYLLVVARTRPPFEAEFEPNDTPGQAQMATFAGTVEATIDDFDPDYYRISLLDFGAPMIIADGQAATLPVDLAFEIDTKFVPWPTIVVNSGVGFGARPAEAVRIPSDTIIRVTGDVLSTQPVLYRLGVFWSGFCPVPVELQSFQVH
jgi:hypothetical protein